MSPQGPTVGESGLQFYGKMSASMSHEIKNALAIINENAGLLQDYSLMAKEGLPISPDRFAVAVSRMVEQVKRADGIVKNMNRLAHSVDVYEAPVDVEDILSLMSALVQRFASVRGVTVEKRPSANPIKVTTSPFFLQNLIWLCLDFAMDASGEGKTVDLASEATTEGAILRFSQLEALGHMEGRDFPEKSTRALLDFLNAKLQIDVEAGELKIVLPAQITR